LELGSNHGVEEARRTAVVAIGKMDWDDLQNKIIRLDFLFLLYQDKRKITTPFFYTLPTIKKLSITKAIKSF